MAIIKDGFAGGLLKIRVHTGDHERLASIWTDMKVDYSRIQTVYAEEGDDLRQEYLHYATLTELVELRDEINKAIKELAGV